MKETYVVRAKKIVTAGPLGAIEQGALVVEDGILLRVVPEGELTPEERALPLVDFGELTVTPALADCHCHLLEYAARVFVSGSGIRPICWRGKPSC